MRSLLALECVSHRFRFTSIESPCGRAMAQALGSDPDDPDTNAVVLNGRALRRSDAALAVLGTLHGWCWCWVGMPRIVRNAVYSLIARNPYRIFGRRDFCDLGGASLADRVIVDAIRSEFL
jgi:predicted DCC family thiol-disulfide oxidoreductase YuxK